ncbi:zinc finger BED domain-containing protein RICESLEEPER 2-like [Corylus avellana]|uniref:zinc finger BED domain-containing protein RICESLEEPER 2-like n=1 Tax=Corylus avellana TaxID=13451 RepID=UPI00286B93D8|nr:zinc finger BED domain-containing protein RICESLEEPER 2-like [Corylus avellana]
MEGDSNQLHPMVDVEEYENEDSIGISNVGTDSSPENEVAQDIVSNEVPNQEDLEKIAYQRKQRKKTSHVWEHYIEVKIKGKAKYQCKWCMRAFSVSSSSCASTLGRHLKKCNTFLGAKDKKKQKVLSIDGTMDGDGVGSIRNFTYDERKSRELCPHMILYHEYPFNIVEHALFNKFAKSLEPQWAKLSRDAAKNDCFATFEVEKRKLSNLLRSVHKVNITTDMWTSRQRLSYMVVTCHFIDPDWCLNRRVLNFCNVPPPHTGFLIADALQNFFQEWGIENKISAIIVDNAKANDTSLRILKDVFNRRKALLIGGKLFHVRCCAHMTNLLVQDGLDEISLIVDCVRDRIKYLVASESRLIKFSEIAKQLQLASKKLILDVPTRWNSTYKMLSTAIEFKGVFPMYSYMDNGFLWSPSDKDWEKVEKACQLLAVFNDVTNIVSGSDYPTSNLFLPEVWRMKYVLATNCRHENEYIKTMPRKMNVKFLKYWGECNLLMSIAAVLDPRNKMTLIRFCFPLIYQEGDAKKKIDLILDVLKELYNEYLKEYNATVI